jgi:hypothetical protein
LKIDTIRYDNKNIQEIINTFIHAIFNNNESVALKIIENLDEDTSKYIYKLINNYKNVMNIPHSFISKMRENINVKFEKLPIIILKPDINSVLNSEIFVYDDIISKVKYYVPLWHQELHFKLHIIYIDVQIPNNISIDIDNNIIIESNKNIKEIIENENLEIQVGNKLYIINRGEIRLIEYQRIILPSSGIPIIDECDMYSISKKGDVIIELHIKF